MVPLVIKDLKVHKVKLEIRGLLVFLVNKVIKELKVLLVHKVSVVQQGNQEKQDFLVHKEFKVLRVK